MTTTSSSLAVRALLPGLLLLLLTSGCLCGEGVNERDVNLISLEKEWQMGDQLDGQLQERQPMLQDGPVQRYVQRVGERLAEQTDLADRPWTFRVVRSDEVNAFALPGGHIYVNAGLIAAASTPSELAGVVAHEVAHGAARHSTERMTQAYGMDALLRLVTGRESGLIEQVVTRVVRGGAVAKFSRDDEREADRLGLRYLDQAGYDPQGMAAFFQTLLEKHENQPGTLDQFFSSHPLTEERLATVRQQIENLSGSGSGSEASNASADVQQFRRVQQRLRRSSRR